VTWEDAGNAYYMTVEGLNGFGTQHPIITIGLLNALGKSEKKG